MTRPIPRPIPQDEHAERGLIGCLLQTGTSDDMDPAHVLHDGRRLIVNTLDLLRAEGLLHTPRTTHPGHERESGLANAELVVHEIERMGLWPCGSDPRHEIRECLDMATEPSMIDVYIRRLAEAYCRRECIAIHERRLHAAYAGDIAQAIEGTTFARELPA
jgi:hypothetical protein